MNRVRLLQVAVVSAIFTAVIVTLAAVTQATGPTVAQAPTTTGVGLSQGAALAIGAAIAMGITGFGVGLGMGQASASAMAAIAERPEVFGKTMVYVVFIEAVAIYALVIAIMMIGLI